MSEREPELGLGIVEWVDAAAKRIAVRFPAAGEQRLYALGTAVLRRVQFRTGETITTREGTTVVVTQVEEKDGILTYAGAGGSIREDAISDVTSVSLPDERLMAGQVDPGAVFNLRLRALQAQARFRQSPVRGFLGGRVQLIPHQIYILQEVSSRQLPRVLLADEVGLGKTIEACLILQRLLAVGRARRVLVLVPESLVHQWFVELLRRFNLWFSIYDEDRCAAVEHSNPGENPFLGTQLALCATSFPALSEVRRAQAIAAGWDIVVVDEAHHLGWSAQSPSPEYTMVAELAARTPGLLLLTATPTQLGLPGHFARLRLLDPNRYDNFPQFCAEAEEFGSVAAVAGKIVAGRPLAPKDHAALQRIFNRDPARLQQHLEELGQGRPGAREALIRTLLDQHGTGRVMFRNTRAAMTGFPKREYCPAVLTAPAVAATAAAAGEEGAEASDAASTPGAAAPTLQHRAARELRAEEAGVESAIRYSYRDDPRIDWLVGLLRRLRPAKVLLICKSQRKVAAIAAALQEKTSTKAGLFHEGLPLVQRDRNAAWFAEPDGAQLLLCSEIGSEGRNFQFAHHLVLFDLPLNPGLVEQRIGRLDRIGQTETIRIHVPFLAGSSDEVVAAWYHRGLDAFETPLHGGNDYEERFRARLLHLAAGEAGRGPAAPAEVEAFIAETIAFRQALTAKMERGRDRLLELNSFDRPVAERTIEAIRAADADPFLRTFLIELLDHFGVRVKEHEEGDVSLDPSHAYIESFPSIPADGMLATFSRARALAREDIRFITADHPLVQDAVDLLVESPTGSTAFGWMPADEPNLLLEVVYLLEPVADTHWHVEQFLAPQPVRVVVDLRGRDVTAEREVITVAHETDDADIHRFLEQPGFDRSVLQGMLDAAGAEAEKRAQALRQAAEARAGAALTADWQRLVDLQKINDHVRGEEVELARLQLERTRSALAQARLRLDALRLIVEGPREPE